MQQVHINRLGVNSIEFEMDTLELPLSPGEERSFEIVIINYGAPTHVNMSVGESIRGNITVLEDNPYVRHEEYIPLIARIPHDGRVYTKGQFYITVGYGSKIQGFNLNIGHPGPVEKGYGVEVDESLYKPAKQSKQVASSVASCPNSRKKTNQSVQLPSISFDMLQPFMEKLAPHSTSIFLVILALIIIYVLGTIITSMDFSQFFGFYQSVFYSILLTYLMIFLLTRIPRIK